MFCWKIEDWLQRRIWRFRIWYKYTWYLQVPFLSVVIPWDSGKGWCMIEVCTRILICLSPMSIEFRFNSETRTDRISTATRGGSVAHWASSGDSADSKLDEDNMHGERCFPSYSAWEYKQSKVILRRRPESIMIAVQCYVRSLLSGGSLTVFHDEPYVRRTLAWCAIAEATQIFKVDQGGASLVETTSLTMIDSGWRKAWGSINQTWMINVLNLMIDT